ncbi:hypothetical protein MMC19_003921 [Ptychographa xylographoides]|nr:hypothetical protein [Ptychographa xylographoides]
MFAGDPVSDSWTHEGVPRFNFAAMLISSVATDLVLDIAVLSLPLPVIKNLHLTTKRKISVACMFWLGIFCVISSAVRLYYVVQFSNLYNGENNDAFSDTVTYIFLWSNIEPCTSVIAACLPTLGPLLQDGRSPMSLVHSIRSYWSNRSGSTLGRKRMYSTDDDGTRLNVVKNNWLNLDSDGTHGSYA